MIQQARTTVFTIGYEGVGLLLFLSKLKENHIEQVIDVRCNPISRKPGFAKSRLRAELENIGIEYLHIPQLGIPSSMRRDLRTNEDHQRLFDEYEQAILPSAMEQQQMLASAVREKVSVLLCFEADPILCHRTRLVKVLAADNNFITKHIQFVR
ncbi:MAG: DUF488 family protein [Thermoguttaceae bacterium]